MHNCITFSFYNSGTTTSYVIPCEKILLNLIGVKPIRLIKSYARDTINTSVLQVSFYGILNHLIENGSRGNSLLNPVKCLKTHEGFIIFWLMCIVFSQKGLCLKLALKYLAHLGSS